MKKKVLIITMVLSSLIILFGIVTYIRLLIKMSQPKVEIAMESSMVSECLTLVSVAITVWIGFAIYNQVEKKEVEELNKEVKNLMPVLELAEADIKQQLINQMYKIGEISIDYFAKKFNDDKDISAERYAMILEIDILREKLCMPNSKDINTDRKVEWAKIGIEKVEKYKEPHKERCNLERCYIDYTEGDFYFFLGKYYQGIAKKDYYKMAKDLFIKTINLLNINLDIDDNTFNKLTENEQKITVYFSNAVGQCNAHLMVIETEYNLKMSYYMEAKKRLQFAVEKSGFCGKREVYYRNYGCLIENRAMIMHDNKNEVQKELELAYEQYKKAQKINTYSSDVYYVLISNLNKRIRIIMNIPMRKPNSAREISLKDMQFNGYGEQIRKCLEEMKVYLDIASKCFPNNANWYAFYVYWLIYTLCDNNKIKQKVNARNRKLFLSYLMMIDSLQGNSDLCLVAKDEVKDILGEK